MDQAPCSQPLHPNPAHHPSPSRQLPTPLPGPSTRGCCVLQSITIFQVRVCIVGCSYICNQVTLCVPVPGLYILYGFAMWDLASFSRTHFKWKIVISFIDCRTLYLYQLYFLFTNTWYLMLLYLWLFCTNPISNIVMILAQNVELSIEGGKKQGWSSLVTNV